MNGFNRGLNRLRLLIKGCSGSENYSSSGMAWYVAICRGILLKRPVLRAWMVIQALGGSFTGSSAGLADTESRSTENCFRTSRSDPASTFGRERYWTHDHRMV